MRRTITAKVLIILALIAFTAATAWPNEIHLALVVRVLSGDTIEVVIANEHGEIEIPDELQWRAGNDGPLRRVRMIGINCAPNTYVWITHGLGPQARYHVTGLILGQDIWLEYDEAEKDRFGRDLAYVWIDAPSVLIADMLNSQLLLAGLAVTARTPPNVRYSAFFSRFQREAQSSQLEIWGYN